MANAKIGWIKMVFIPPFHWGRLTKDSDLGNWNCLREFADKKVFFASIRFTDTWRELPLDYDCYIVLVEGHNPEWIQLQSEQIQAPIFVIGSINDYSTYDNTASIIHVPSIEWHHWFRAAMLTFGNPPEVVKKTKKISALSYRMNRNKIYGFMSIVQNFDKNEYVVSLNDNVIDKMVDNWQATGRQDLDNMLEDFYINWKGIRINDDGYFDLQTNYASQNPIHRAFSECVFNISNETQSLSDVARADKTFIIPGPFLTEKTWKPLYNGTALIANGPFDTYRTLEYLGFNFDYSDIDLTYDTIPQNFDRFSGMIKTVKSLNKYTVSDLDQITEKSRIHNQYHCISDEFFKFCENINQTALDKIYKEMNW